MKIDFFFILVIWLCFLENLIQPEENALSGVGFMLVPDLMASTGSNRRRTENCSFQAMSHAAVNELLFFLVKVA